MAAHSSALAWRVPWTEEPGGRQSVRLQSDRTEALSLYQVTSRHTVHKSVSFIGDKARLRRVTDCRRPR